MHLSHLIHFIGVVKITVLWCVDLETYVEFHRSFNLRQFMMRFVLLYIDSKTICFMNFLKQFTYLLLFLAYQLLLHEFLDHCVSFFEIFLSHVIDFNGCLTHQVNFTS